MQLPRYLAAPACTGGGQGSAKGKGVASPGELQRVGDPGFDFPDRGLVLEGVNNSIQYSGHL